jgi:hypothetical protein
LKKAQEAYLGAAGAIDKMREPTDEITLLTQFLIEAEKTD